MKWLCLRTTQWGDGFNGVKPFLKSHMLCIFYTTKTFSIHIDRNIYMYTIHVIQEKNCWLIRILGATNTHHSSDPSFKFQWLHCSSIMRFFLILSSAHVLNGYQDSQILVCFLLKCVSIIDWCKCGLSWTHVFCFVTSKNWTPKLFLLEIGLNCWSIMK